MISTSPVPKFRYLLHQSHQSHRSYLEYFGHHFVHLPTVSSHPLLHPHHHHQNQKQKHYFFTFPSRETFLINFYKTEIDISQTFVLYMQVGNLNEIYSIELL